MCTIQRHLDKGARGTQIQPVPDSPGCVSRCFFMVALPRGHIFHKGAVFELVALPARGCSPLTEILMILSNMTSGETWKSKTKYWRGEGRRAADTRWAAANSRGSARPSLLAVPVCTPASPLVPGVQMSSGGDHWSSLTWGRWELCSPEQHII